jgi:hypothetical protein
MMKQGVRVLILTLLAAATHASAPSSADADVLGYAVDTNETLYSVDFTTAKVTAIGQTGQFIEGLAVAPDGTLFGTDSSGLLFQISPTTGNATPIGSTGLGDVEGLVFKGGTLLGTDFSNPTSVYTIDTTTGSPTLLVTTNPGQGVARALALADSNTAYIVSNSPTVQSLVSVNLTTGATVVLGTIDDPNLIAAISVGPGGTIYALDSVGQELIVNQDGSTQLVGSTGGQFWLDSTIISASVPEPSSLALLGVAGAVFVGRRFRRGKAVA